MDIIEQLKQKSEKKTKRNEKRNGLRTCYFEKSNRYIF